MYMSQAASILAAKTFVHQFNDLLNGTVPFDAGSGQLFANQLHARFSFVNANGTILNKYGFLHWLQASNTDLKSTEFQSCYHVETDSFFVVNALQHNNYIISARLHIEQPSFLRIFCAHNNVQQTDNLPRAIQQILRGQQCTMTLIVCQQKIRFVVCAFYRYIADCRGLEPYAFDKEIAWYSSSIESMNRSFVHDTIYNVDEIHTALLSVLQSMPDGLCLLIAEYANNVFTVGIENCIFPFCASYAAYCRNKEMKYYEYMLETLHEKFYIINAMDNGREYQTFVSGIKLMGGLSASEYQVKNREYQCIDTFDDLLVISYEEWHGDDSFYYLVTPIFCMINDDEDVDDECDVFANKENMHNIRNKKKKVRRRNPILFIHAHVVVPFDRNAQFNTKRILTDLRTWNENQKHA